MAGSSMVQGHFAASDYTIRQDPAAAVQAGNKHADFNFRGADFLCGHYMIPVYGTVP
jgi:hypothetical protein